MTDALGSSLAASLSIAAHYIAPPTSPVPATDPVQPVNLSAPAYVNPTVTFSPDTDIVILTYRNADTGKVTEQYPPSEVLSRYQFVDETGMPIPTPPGSPKDQHAQVNSGPSGSPPPPTTQASPPSSGPASGTNPGTLA